MISSGPFDRIPSLNPQSKGIIELYDAAAEISIGLNRGLWTFFLFCTALFSSQKNDHLITRAASNHTHTHTYIHKLRISMYCIQNTPFINTNVQALKRNTHNDSDSLFYK